LKTPNPVGFIVFNWVLAFEVKFGSCTRRNLLGYGFCELSYQNEHCLIVFTSSKYAKNLQIDRFMVSQIEA